ncbi:MAG: efflux RND transporter periplasmic adaptor subunit [Gammaproteobacteria bacterium]|nr:efflux RND transporter periplasmic adaptor subunit [Gammaproteobacteria bacterium]
MVFHYVTKWLTHKPPQASPYPLVVVQKPKLIQMTDYVTQTGTMVAFNSVDLVARIEGYLNAIEFTDGTFIKKGQGLFVIEPEPYLEKVKEAQASVVIAKASYAYANAEFHRQKKMYTQNATSLNNVEKWQAQAEKTKAEIDKANANEVVAQINYSYTHVLAPFDGRIGRHLVDIGNLVGNGVATDLATIEQIDPIYAYFNLNELDLIKIRSAARATAFNPENLAQVPVEVSMQGETGFPHKGSMNFVNTGLNASTGTMEFRALLTNHDYTLLPGLFVQVRIPITKPKPQLTIPDAAVQYDQIGAYVLVMDKQQMVSVKRVSVGVLEQGVRAIKTGLDAQDDVIISGIQNAVPNHQVTPVQREKKPA